MAKIMATGYIHTMLDDKQSFEQFAWSCARQFGALILMRDDAVDAEIPEAFKPSDSYSKRLRESQDKLTRLKAMTPQEWTAEWTRLQAEQIANWRKDVLETAQERRRIEEMLAEVQSWKPPTADHAGLKKFMLEQLTKSLENADSDFANKEIQRLSNITPDQWRTAEAESLIRSIARYAEEDLKERERTEGRNRWIKQLRDSLSAVKA